METLQAAFEVVAAYFRSGFYSVNAVQGLLISLFAAYSLHSWRQLFVIALGAVAAHVVLDVMMPVFGGAAFQLPPLVEPDYWRHLLRLYAGYLVVIGVFYLVKRLLGGR